MQNLISKSRNLNQSKIIRGNMLCGSICCLMHNIHIPLYVNVWIIDIFVFCKQLRKFLQTIKISPLQNLRSLNLNKIKNHETLIKQVTVIIRLSLAERDDKQTQVTRPVVKELLKLLESNLHHKRKLQEMEETVTCTESMQPKLLQANSSLRVCYFSWFDKKTF